MKKLKNLSLFRVSISFLIATLFFNKYIFLIILIYLLFINYKEALLFLFLIVLYYFLYNYSSDFINIGYVESINNNYVTINKFLYKTRLYCDTSNLKVGYLIKTTNQYVKISDSNILKNNIKFNNYDFYSVLKKETLYYKNYLKLSTYSVDISSFIKKIIFNEYIDNNELNIFYGYGLTSYFLLRFVFRKNKHLSMCMLLLMIFAFGFETKYILILIDYILSFTNLNRLNKYSTRLIIITFINCYLVFNYSFLITLLFGLINFINIDNKLYICIIQSVLFGEINLLLSLLYKYYVYFPILLYLFGLLIMFIPSSSNIIFNLIKLISSFISYLNISVRGRISIFVLTIILLINKYYKNTYINIFICILLIMSPLNNPFTHISFIDVGQGDAILIKGGLEKYNVLIDTGSKYNYNKLKTYLFKEGIYRINYLVVTHNDSDHNGNIENLKKDFKISEIVDKPMDIKIKDLYLKNLFIGRFNNDNENSLVYTTKINDISILFTGDITKNVEKLLINKYKLQDIDILKVSHHGSDTGTSNILVSEILPRFAIISTNGNYGHPKKSVIDLLDSFLVKTYITKDDGDIIFYLNKYFKCVKTGKFHFDIINS